LIAGSPLYKEMVLRQQLEAAVEGGDSDGQEE